MAGYIYIFTNPGFEQYVKIGYADDWEKRLKDLSNKSSVPYAFRCYAIYSVNKRLEDKVLHNMIDQLNPDLRTVDNIDGKKRRSLGYEARSLQPDMPENQQSWFKYWFKKTE